MRVKSHLLRVTLDDGHFLTTVDCPDADRGADRPCAVWANDDGTETTDECTFQQYAEACGLDDWLHGRIELAPVAIKCAESGGEWHARVTESSLTAPTPNGGAVSGAVNRDADSVHTGRVLTGRHPK